MIDSGARPTSTGVRSGSDSSRAVAAGKSRHGSAPPSDIPVVPGLPWIGRLRDLLAQPGEFGLRCYREHGRVFAVPLLGDRLVHLIGPEANRLILATRRECFSHAAGYELVRHYFGDGLLFQDGDVHRRNRMLLTPAFHAAGVQGYFESISAIVAEHVSRWCAEPHGLLHERFRALTFEIAARLILGADAGDQIARLSHWNDLLARGSVGWVRVPLPLTAWRRGLAARAALHDHLRRVIRRRRAEIDAGASPRDALGLLLTATDEAGGRLGESELLDQAVILIFAGHETTTSMLSSALICLRDHPEITQSLEDERCAVAGDAPVGSDRLRELTLLDAFLKEVERLHAPISLCQRGVVEDIEFDGHRLPSGTSVVYSPYVTHRLPEVFAEPDRFDPTRFLAPREEHKRTPYSLIGFGGGPRLCIGQAFAQMEMKIVLTEMLRRTRWRLEERGPVARGWVPTLHPLRGLPGVVEAR